jgi:hypothetical protein
MQREIARPVPAAGEAHSEESAQAAERQREIAQRDVCPRPHAFEARSHIPRFGLVDGAARLARSKLRERHGFMRFRD